MKKLKAKTTEIKTIKKYAVANQDSAGYWYIGSFQNTEEEAMQFSIYDMSSSMEKRLIVVELPL